MAEAYELQYKKVHNTLEKPAGNSVYGNQVGQRVNNLLAPKITMETLGEYSIPLPPPDPESASDPRNSPYAIQVTADHLTNKDYFINSDFYKPETEYELATEKNETTKEVKYVAKPSCLSRYKRRWYRGTVIKARNTFCPLTANFQDKRSYTSLVGGQGTTSLDGYSMICSHKILIDASKNYMFQLSTGTTDSLPSGWKIGFQLMCENIAEGAINNAPANSKHYTQAYTQFDSNSIINGWSGKPIAINLNKIMIDDATIQKFTNPLQYTYIDKIEVQGSDPIKYISYVDSWAPWQKARYQYLIIYLFIPNDAAIALAENYQFFLYEGEEVAILDHQGTILGFTSETPLHLQLSPNIESVATWTLQDSGIFTDENFKPSFEISADGDLVLKLAAVKTTSTNDVTLKDILAYLKATDKELVAIPYIDYNTYYENKGKSINKTRSLKYKNSGVKRLYTESNWVKYINVVRSEKDKNHFYETNQEITIGSEKRYSSYVCNPDVHIGAYRFDYFIKSGNIDTSTWSIPFSHASNSTALPQKTTERYNAYNLECLSFDNSVFKVAQPKEYAHNEKPIFITLPDDVEKVRTFFQKKYHFTPIIQRLYHGIPEPINPTLPPANPPTRPDITIVAKAAPRRAPSTNIDVSGIKPMQPIYEYKSYSAFVKQDKHLYLRPVKDGDPLPGLQIFGNCRAHPLNPKAEDGMELSEEEEVLNALSAATHTDNTSLDYSAIKWVKIFFQWEVWEWGNKKRLTDPIIGDRFGLWGRNDVIFQKEKMMNINHSPFIYIAQACSWCDSSTAVDDKIPFYFEWQDITFAKTENDNIIAFPTAWIKKP